MDTNKQVACYNFTHQQFVGNRQGSRHIIGSYPDLICATDECHGSRDEHLNCIIAFTCNFVLIL